MSKDTEIDMKEVELNELDPEKQPMTGDGQAPAGEKNGTVKVKVPDDEVTFTGLSKEELMKVAGTPGWVRTRMVLLILFWLGWLGMLAGAIAIIVNAPRCKPIPEMNWWNEGPLYQVPDVVAFADGMEGVESKLDAMNQLKVKGLVLGPLHSVQANEPNTLDLEAIHPDQGTQEELVAVLKKAEKKGMSVVLDLTPNYLGATPWFGAADTNNVMEKLKAAAEHWLDLGVSGIKISGLTVAAGSPEWSNLHAVVMGNQTEGSKKRALIGVAEGISAMELSQLVNTSGVSLALSDLLSSTSGGVERIKAMDTLHPDQRSLAWGLGAAQKDQLSRLAKTPSLIRLYQLLLFTMPGTPVFTYGDEIGLKAAEMGNVSKMVWDSETEPAEGAVVDEAAEAERKEQVAVKKWFKTLSDLRGKKRSLLYGDYYPLYSSANSLAFLRVWDQSERYITAANWGDAPEKLKFSLTPTAEKLELPESAEVISSTAKELAEESTVSLDSITLGPGEAVLLQFPYVA